jgi:D-glycero-beta-D-manno-heptose-7-phosphate kinase
MSESIGGISTAGLREVLQRLSGVPVLVLADLVLDEFRYGEPSRVSREAPVLILDHRKTDLLPGGGANAVANLKALGAIPVPLGRVGDDASGDALLKSFKRRGIASQHVWTPDRYETPTKTRILAGGAHSVKQQVVRIDTGRPAAMTPGEEEHFRSALRRALPECRGVLVSDYGYGMLHAANIPHILAILREARVPVVVDSRSQLPLYRGITAAAPNLEEAERAAGISVHNDTSLLEQAGTRLREVLAADAVLVTLGSRGMALFAQGREGVHLPVYGTDEVADVTGAGDTVAAAFCAALVAGGSALEAAALANVAAGLVVMKRGTATVSPEEITRALRGLQEK